MTLAAPAGQLLFAGFEGTEVPDDLADLVAQGRLGGVILFSRNLGDPRQVRALVDELHRLAPGDTPLSVCIDQEGGRVQRLRAPWTEWPAMQRLGARDSLESTRAVARGLARELADLRIDLDFAPVVDVDTCPENPVIGDRSFSSAARAVARHAAAFIQAMQGEGVAACAKHFPGHGDTTADSHLELPVVEHGLDRLRAVELVPFAAAVQAGVASVMTAHVSFPKLDPHRPATLSSAALGLLRRELGFDGLVFSDDLDMAAVADRFAPDELVRTALEAGVDALLVCRSSERRDAVLAQLEALPHALLSASLERLRAFKEQYAGGRRAAGTLPPYREHIQLAASLEKPPTA